MKLDTKSLRYLTNEDWRVLTAVEQGSRNHEVVPTPLIIKLSGLRSGSGVHKSISILAKINLIARTQNAKYDGYRLTYGGLDYLALHTLQKRNLVYSVGNQIGVGKESDIFVVAPPAVDRKPSPSSASDIQQVLKIHRLGRISFRTVKNNRDYLRNRSSSSWMHMSRLAAAKEFAFATALNEHQFRVPVPISQNRHTVLMELVDAFPLRQITDVPDPAALYGELIEIALRLAQFGLIHGDYNEFNILIKEEDEQCKQSKSSESKEGIEAETGASIKLAPVIIDFPQTLSMDHPNAAMYFDRDIACIKRFFKRRFGFESTVPGPTYKDARNRLGTDGAARLDVEVEASGFSKKMAKELEDYMAAVGVDGDNYGAGTAEEDQEMDEDAEDDGDEEEAEGRQGVDKTEIDHLSSETPEVFSTSGVTNGETAALKAERSALPSIDRLEINS